MMAGTRSQVVGAASVLLGVAVLLAGGRAAVEAAGAESGQFAWWVDAAVPLFLAVLVGGSAVVAGVLGYVGRRPQYTTSVAVGTGTGAAVLVADVAPELPAFGLSELDAAVAVGVAAGGAAWYALGWYWP